MSPPGDSSTKGYGWVLLDRAKRYPKCFFFLLGALFCAPALWGDVFLPISYLALTPLWYDPRVITGNYDLFDAIIYFAPIDSFLQKELSDGVFPFWNPYNLAGHPVAFNGQSGMLYPVKLFLLCLFPLSLATTASLWLHLSAAGAGAFYLGRRMELSEEAALFLGLSWMFNGYLAGWMELGFIANCACWTPILILAALRALESWKAVAWTAAALAMLLLSAHLQFVIYFLVFGTMLGLHLSLGRWSSLGGVRFVLGCVLGVGLAAPYLWSSALLMSGSQRPVMTFDFLLSSYRQFLVGAPGTFVFPDLHGNPSDLFVWQRIAGYGNFIYSETVLYLGVLPLLFALAAFADSRGRVYLGAATATLLLPATPLFLLVTYLPGLSRVNSIRWVGLVHLLLIVAAAYGFERWLKQGRCRGAIWAYRALLLLAGYAVASLIDTVSQGWQAALRPGAIRLPEPSMFLEPELFVGAVKAGFEQCYSLTNPNFILPFLLFLSLGAILGSPKRYAPLVLFLTTVELISFSYRFNPAEPASQLFQETPITKYLTEQSGSGRVVGLSTVKPNTLLPYRIREVGGYDSFYPRDSAIFLQALMGQTLRDGSLPGQVQLGDTPVWTLLDHLSAGYAIGLPGGKEPPWPLVFDEGLLVYENPHPLPRAGVYGRVERVDSVEQRISKLLDPSFPRREVALVESDLLLDDQAKGSAEILDDGSNTVTVRAESQGKALLVLNDAWCPGWEATVNGQPRPIHKVNQMFRGVEIEAGDSMIEFVFRPPGWSTGVRFFWLSAILCLLLVVISPRRKCQTV